ncbi:MAG TPA: quinoprotein dehydrogenase-associated SoxYZ-like carrier [Acetobacteraceae bacterium]|nr:quinoprotein dehydrogenase-associated SoxYZ-like carrier [Acetobacteraceae bacterium]
MRNLLRYAVLCGAAMLPLAAAHAQDDAAARAQRWQVLRHAIFGDRPMQDGRDVLTLQAPYRAEDAALVPVAIMLKQPEKVKALYLVIDNNPSPLAAHFSFGPDADPREIRLRVRVNDYTDVHAVAELQSGALYSVADFVKAAGGCSAPAGQSEAEALQGLGEMKLRMLGAYAPGKPLQVKLLIRHPDFNGMQMNQVTRLVTPARFIDSTEVSYNGAKVFHLETGISLSSDPAITFGFVPDGAGQLQVVARDSDQTVFRHDFAIPKPNS